MPNARSVLLLLAVAGCRAGEAPRAPAAPVAGPTVAPDTIDVQGVREARAAIESEGRADGAIRLVQVDGGVRLLMELGGLTPRVRHGVQILHGRDCSSDPAVHLGAADGTPHGSPQRAAADRHAGDLGNVRAADDGNARYDRVDRVVRLDSVGSAVGRAVVVRERADDGVTAPDGGAGAVVGCGVFEAVR